MNFLKELDAHLETFETEVKTEIQSFITYVKSKYSEPAAAVVSAPAPIAPNGELTIAQPVPAVVEEVEEQAPELVQEEAEEQPIEATEEQAADQTLDVPVE